MQRLTRKVIRGIFCLLVVAWGQANPALARPANVVFILTDNQGAWTLGCYGNPDIQTPHIDKLSQEGIRFNRALSSNPVCSPTRATFLTGLIPSQHGVHSFLDREFMMGPKAYNTLAEFTSLGEILKDSGYVCGLSGKWHLGDNLNPSEGFSAWITKPEGSTAEFYNQKIVENGAVREEAGYTTDLWTREGIKFIETNQSKPFFLFLAYNGPYVLGNLMLKESQNRHVEKYRDHHFKSFPVDTMHPWQLHNKQFHNKQIAMERTACEVSGVDDGVGEVMATLKRLNLDEDTLVVYASDQGWMGGQNGIWGMGDHLHPTGAHELMMRIPFIFRQPKSIPANSTSDLLVSNYDFLPTLVDYLGLQDRLPKTPKLPGRSFSKALRGEKINDWTEAVFYEMETTRAIRTADWKFITRFPQGPYELYDMKADPHERFNLFGQPTSQDIYKDLNRQLSEFFETYADPQYDLWRGGKSKCKIHSK